jgi:hypothetical protein
MLERWQLPERLVAAIAIPKRLSRLERLSQSEGDLPQILHLAELLSQLVGYGREEALPELLEAGKIYRGMTKSKLAALVEVLQEQVDQLAEVLSLELTSDRDYLQMLITSQNKMAAMSESVASQMATSEDESIYTELLAHTGELTEAMQLFLTGKKPKLVAGGQKTQSHAAHYGQHVVRGFVGKRTDEMPDQALLMRKLVAAATRCRERRQEVSLLLAEPNVFDVHTDPQAKLASQEAKHAIELACREIDANKFAAVQVSPSRLAVVLYDCDRRGALAIAHHAIAELSRLRADSMVESDLSTTLSIGVATVGAVPKNFDPSAVVESALRCLAAARTCGISAVKSIEV